MEVAGLQAPPAGVNMRPATSVTEGRSSTSSMEQTAGLPMTTVDKIIMVCIVVAIIVFAAYQISESINAHKNPASETATERTPRVFPAVMLCPFSHDTVNQPRIKGESGAPSACPLWSPQAVLSFRLRKQSQGGPGGSGFGAYNTNADVESNRRERSICPNIPPKGPVEDFSIHFSSSSADFADPYEDVQFVNVKNTAPPQDFVSCEENWISPPGGDKKVCNSTQMLLPDYERVPCWPPCNWTLIREDNVPLFCNSFTPPTVQCMVIDPLIFEKKARSGFNSRCNPMREVRANSIDSFRVRLPYGRLHYTYSGLERVSYYNKEKLSFSKDRFKANYLQKWPSSFQSFAFPEVLSGPEPTNSGNNLTDSIFGGLLAVFYDPFRGPPEGLDFDRSRRNELTTGSVLGSTVLHKFDCSVPTQFSSTIKCAHAISPAVAVSVTTRLERIIDQESASRPLLNKTQYQITIQPAAVDTAGSTVNNREYDLSMSFVSETSVVTTQVVTLTVLTTVSIILSTAATLWGSQQKIKSGITWLLNNLEKRGYGPPASWNWCSSLMRHDEQSATTAQSTRSHAAAIAVDPSTSLKTSLGSLELSKPVPPHTAVELDVLSPGLRHAHPGVQLDQTHVNATSVGGSASDPLRQLAPEPPISRSRSVHPPSSSSSALGLTADDTLRAIQTVSHPTNASKAHGPAYAATPQILQSMTQESVAQSSGMPLSPPRSRSKSRPSVTTGPQSASNHESVRESPAAAAAASTPQKSTDQNSDGGAALTSARTDRQREHGLSRKLSSKKFPFASDSRAYV